MEIILTCHIENCINCDLPIHATVEDITTVTAYCGGCENQITDIVEAPAVTVTKSKK